MWKNYTSVHCWWEYKICQHNRKSMEVPQTNGANMQSRNPAPGIYLNKWKSGSWRDFFTSIFIAPLFTIAKMQKHPRYLSMNEKINKMWYISMLDYYSTLKKNKILLYVTTGTNLKDIMLNEISLSQKDSYCLIPLVRSI